MDRFIDAINKSVETANWFSALTLALTMPDICGRLEDPSLGSGARYKKWWEIYMLPNYQRTNAIDGRQITFLSGGDAYALRCSYLHEGGADISLQKARVALDNFHFVYPEPNTEMHCNKVNNVLQLQVDIFAAQMCSAVREWDADVSGKQEIQVRKSGLLRIRSANDGIPGFLSW